MTQDSIQVSSRDGYREITLNRPDRLNAFNDDLTSRLLEELNAADSDTNCRAVLITGAGRGFCAGQDIAGRDFSNGPPDLEASLSTRYNPIINSIRTLRMPVVAAVNGVAAGAGVAVALACDIVLAAQSAKFTLSFAKLGLVPDAGLSWILPRLMGDAMARGAIFLSEPIIAHRAAEMGMIWEAVPDDQLLSKARGMCGNFALGPTAGYELIKKVLLKSGANGLEQQLALEAKLQGQAGRTSDYQHAVEAFQNKTVPQFYGR